MEFWGVAYSGTPQVFSLLHLHWTFYSENCPNVCAPLHLPFPQIHSLIMFFCLSIQISPPITSYSTFFSSQQLKPSKDDYLEMAEILISSFIRSSGISGQEEWGTQWWRAPPASTTRIMKTQDCTNDMTEGKGPWSSQEKENTSEWEDHKIS